MQHDVGLGGQHAAHGLADDALVVDEEDDDGVSVRPGKLGHWFHDRRAIVLVLVIVIVIAAESEVRSITSTSTSTTVSSPAQISDDSQRHELRCAPGAGPRSRRHPRRRAAAYPRRRCCALLGDGVKPGAAQGEQAARAVAPHAVEQDAAAAAGDAASDALEEHSIDGRCSESRGASINRGAGRRVGRGVHRRPPTRRGRRAAVAARSAEQRTARRGGRASAPGRVRRRIHVLDTATAAGSSAGSARYARSQRGWTAGGRADRNQRRHPTRRGPNIGHIGCGVGMTSRKLAVARQRPHGGDLRTSSATPSRPPPQAEPRRGDGVERAASERLVDLANVAAHRSGHDQTGQGERCMISRVAATPSMPA